MAESPDLSALNYTVLVPYNGTTATGGDPMEIDLNVFYKVRSSSFHSVNAVFEANLYLLFKVGDITWILVCTALVLLMIPGVGYVPLFGI